MKIKNSFKRFFKKKRKLLPNTDEVFIFLKDILMIMFRVYVFASVVDLVIIALEGTILWAVNNGQNKFALASIEKVLRNLQSLSHTVIGFIEKIATAIIGWKARGLYNDIIENKPISKKSIENDKDDLNRMSNCDCGKNTEKN